MQNFQNFSFLLRKLTFYLKEGVGLNFTQFQLQLSRLKVNHIQGISEEVYERLHGLKVMEVPSNFWYLFCTLQKQTNILTLGSIPPRQGSVPNHRHQINIHSEEG